MEAKHNIKDLVKHKKSEFYKKKLTENVGKPKELWKTLKTLGLPSKKGSVTNICLEEDNVTHFEDNKNKTKCFQIIYSSFTNHLVKNLPPPPMKFDALSVEKYYEKTKISRYKI